MSAESVLWSYEEQAEDNLTPSDNQVSSGGILYSGGGKNSRGKKRLKPGGNLKKFGALGFIMIALLFFVVDTFCNIKSLIRGNRCSICRCYYE